MKRIIWIPLTVPLLLASPAFAAGIDLSWDNCAADGGTSDIVFDCATYGGTERLFGSWISDVTIPRFHTLELIIDLEADAPDLPAFWDFFQAATGKSGSIPIRSNRSVGPTHAPGDRTHQEVGRSRWLTTRTLAVWPTVDASMAGSTA